MEEIIMINRRTTGLVTAFLIFITIGIAPAQTQDVVQQIGNAGAVDWTNQMITSTGIGAPNPNVPPAAQRAGAIEAAKRVALRNLLETVRGMALNSDVTVENAMTTNDVIRTRIQGVVKNFTVKDIRYMSDGSVEVDVTMPISGAFADLILPQQFGGGRLMVSSQPLCPTCGQPWPKGKPVPPGVKLIYPKGQQPQAAQNITYTGLIVDARGLHVRPAMAPRVLDESGQEIYGSKYVSRDYAVQIGMVGYAKELNQARNSDRVKNNPLVIKAVKVSGPNMSDVVITNADAQLIHSSASTMNFLDHCRVMFLVD